MPKVKKTTKTFGEKKKNIKFFSKRPKQKVEKKSDGGKEKLKKGLSLLRGMHDILPKEDKYWKKAYHTSENLADYFQFGRIRTPALEEASLFIRSIGKGTDVVDKEMYVFEDRDGSKACLRPEATAAVARSYIMHGMWNYPQPIKLWYWGEMFRHDRPQAGRFRNFYQVGFETIGIDDPVADAELILVTYNFYKELGLPVEIRINSIGTLEEREKFKTELLSYYRSKRSYLCEDCRKRMFKNTLRVLDCKEEQCQPVKEGAPQIIDWLGEASKSHFMKVVEYLDELSIPYVLTPGLVRGLDYYTNTVFEIYPTFGEEGSQSALGGGGRYNALIESMGGKPTPAAGVAIGIERSIASWRAYNELNNIAIQSEKPDIFFAYLGEQAKGPALRLIEELRNNDIKLGFNFFKTSLKNQLEAANNFKVPYTIILGQKEVQENSVIIRDMESGIQEIANQKKLVGILKKKLGK